MQKNRGAALLEVIVAIGIVTLVMTTIVSLVSVSLKSASFSQSKTLGTKYSQEGMESLRQMRTLAGWDTFLSALQADGSTIHYCLPTVPHTIAEFAALTNTACTSTQFVDSKSLFQRQADITVTTNAGKTSIAINVKTTWYDSGVQKSSSIGQQFEQYKVDDAPTPIVYSPLPYIPYGFTAGVWTHRQSIAVANTTGAVQTDYQVMATLNTASMISASNMQSNCADLRVTASDGITNLPFWIEPTTCNTAATKVWVKVASIPTSGTTIYAIYGNATAVDAGYYSTDVFIRNIPTLGAAWAMNESSWSGVAGEVKDSSGNNNNGVALTATITGGKFGNGGLFNGTTGIIQVPDSPTVGPASAISISAWLKTTGTNANAVIVGKSTGCATNGYLVWLNENAVGAGKPGYWASAGGWVVSPAVLSDGNWHHLVTAFNSATVEIYVDGVLSISAARTSAIDNANLLEIGGANVAGGGCNNFWFNGVLDDVQIYDRSISAVEVADMWGQAKNQVYSTPNFPSVGLVRKYLGGVTVGTPGAEQSGSYVFSSQNQTAPTVVAYYKFDGSGTTAADSSGNSLTGTWAGTGTHWVSTGVNHSAGTFNGTGDGVNLASPTQLDFGNNGEFTFDGWVKPSVMVDYAGFVSKDTNRQTPYSYMTVMMANGRLSANNGSIWIDICPAGSVTRGVWQHIAFSYNGSTLNGYVNGNNCGSVSFSYNDNAAHSVWIGSWYTGSTIYDFNGTMDEVKIYNGGLTQAEIQADYNANAANIIKPFSNLAFNEGTGTTVADSSGNSNPGTWYGTGLHWVGSTGNFAGKFNGNGDGVNVGTDPLFNLGSSEPFSFEGWIKPAVLKDYGNFVSKVAPGRIAPYSYLTVTMADGRLMIYDSTVGWHQVCPAGAVVVGNWQHIAFTYDGGTVTGYVNGTQCGTFAGYAYTDVSTHIVNIGSWSSNPVYDFNGLIDQVTMYDYKRSATQILADKNAYTAPAGSWLYRVPITLTNTTGAALTSYQTLLKINTAALITAGKMNSDCSDLRITDSNGTSKLPFWMETGATGCNTASSNVWVKVPSVATSGDSVYAYYGNGLAADIGDGTQVFDFFDDFETATLDTAKWTATGAYTINAAGELVITTGAVYSKAPVVASTLNEMFEMRARFATVNTTYSGLAISNATSIAGGNATPNKMAMIQTNTSISNAMIAFASNGAAVAYNVVSNVLQYTPVAASNNFAGFAYTPTQLNYYHDRAQTGGYLTNVAYSPYLILGFFTGSLAGVTDTTDVAINFVDVRKVAFPEPTATVTTEAAGSWTGL